MVFVFPSRHCPSPGPNRIVGRDRVLFIRRACDTLFRHLCYAAPGRNDLMRALASRLNVMSGEGALSVFARAKELERQGRSIIHLELGEPDFHPAESVIGALEKALRAGKDRYCSVAGIPALREELARYLGRTRNLPVDPGNIVIAPGCK